MGRLWPIVGRDGVLSRIAAAVAAGDGVVVVGGAGAGKTVLLGEVRRRVEAAGGRAELIVGAAANDGFPFEPFLGMLDDRAAPPGEGEVVGQLSVVLRGGQADAAMPALLVDDAHLLDDASARVLLRLAATREARVVATVRADEELPEAVERLWRDSGCVLVDLEPLKDGDVHRLLETVLGGQVDPVATRHLCGLAAGNALFLRELVQDALDRGSFVVSHGVHGLAEEPTVGGGLLAMVRQRLARLTVAERGLLELIALGEPFPTSALGSLVDADLLEGMESAGLVAARDTLAGEVVVAGHPVYGEVARAGVPTLRRRRILLRLARATEMSRPGDASDVVRAALWRLDAGEPGDPRRLVEAASAARSSSLAIAERLARAAITATGDTDAVVLLAEILTHAGRAREAQDLLAGLPPATLEPAEREAIAYCRALGATLHGAPGQGTAILDALEGGEGSAPRLRALHAMLLFFDGRIDDAVAAGLPVAASADPGVSVQAASAVIGGYHYLGRFTALEALADTAIRQAHEARDMPPYAIGQVKVITLPALADAGRLDHAQWLAQEMLDRAVAGGDDWERSRGAFCLGRVALLRGQVQSAVEMFRLTVASLNEFDQMFLSYNLSVLARSAAVAGLRDEARDALRLPPGTARLPVFEAEWELAQAHVSAADGQLADAAERAAWAAELASSRHQWLTAVVAGHDAARFGGAASIVSVVREAAGHVEGPLAPCYAEYVAALAAEDAKALDEVSRAFETVGTLLYAAEAAAAAGAAHRAAGRPREGLTSTAHSTDLLARCEGPVLPWLATMTSSDPVTAREREVAVLAAVGRSDREIAEQLAISVRTVETHLARVYTKLGIHRRQDIADAIGS